MTYQDVWCKGIRVVTGERECAKRYQIVRDFCSQYNRPFTVLDIGAAQGYFSLRLAEDFDCTCVAIEHRGDLRAILETNQQSRVLWLQRRFTLDDLITLGKVEHFDVVLGLSVVHWLGHTPDESLSVMRRLGEHLILELAQEKEACGQSVVRETEIPQDAMILGYGESHVHAGAQRPIVLLSQSKTTLARRYIGNKEPVDITIESDFESKRLVKQSETRDWHRGINLHTFMRLGGDWPTYEHITNLIKQAASEPHGDLRAWNVILQGDAVQLIDAKPGQAEMDKQFLEELMQVLAR